MNHLNQADKARRHSRSPLLPHSTMSARADAPRIPTQHAGHADSAAAPRAPGVRDRGAHGGPRRGERVDPIPSHRGRGVGRSARAARSHRHSRAYRSRDRVEAVGGPGRAQKGLGLGLGGEWRCAVDGDAADTWTRTDASGGRAGCAVPATCWEWW